MKITANFMALLALGMQVDGLSSAGSIDSSLQVRAANKPSPSYQQVVAAALKKWPSMQAVSTAGRFSYNLKPCGEKCQSKNQVDDKDGKCKDCPKGQKPNADRTSCVSALKEQGKCEDGKVLDPSVGGQDTNTESPKCLADDDSKCPSGQVAVSRDRKNRDIEDHNPQCAEDDSPDFTCENPNTYDFKTASGGKIQHSCRPTQKYEEEKRNKYNERVTTAKDSKTAKGPEAREERRKQNRTGWCFVAVASLGAFDEFGSDIDALTDDEIDGMYAHFPDDAPDPSGDGSIPNNLVENQASLTVTGIGMDSAGLGALFGAIPKAIAPIKGATSSSRAIRNIRSGTRRGPSSAAKKASADSATVSRIFKDERMIDCVFSISAAGAGLSRRDDVTVLEVGNLKTTIDWSRGPTYAAPEGDQIQVSFDSLEDRLRTARYTSSSEYYVGARIPYEQCMKSPLDNAIVSLEVKNGCCAMYDGSECEPDTHMFDMENREHQDLQGDHRSTISSWWCTKKGWCDGRP